MILIRADANSVIGTGHVMRCSSVAKALLRKGEDIIFVTADHLADNLIKNLEVKHLVLNSTWNQMDQEIQTMLELINEYHPNLILVDSYFITKKYFQILNQKCKIAYFDDMNTDCWDIDFLINYNVYSQIYDYSSYKDTKTKLMLGTSYTPLRDEFLSAKKRITKTTPSDIMISAGGSDPENITEKLMNVVVSDRELDTYKFHFIVGSLNPRIDEIVSIAKKKDNIYLHINEKNMSSLMEKCDIAISASGTTLYELCACGVPTITYILADNQIVAANQFCDMNIMKNAGDCRNNQDFTRNLIESLKDLISDYGLRSRMSEEMQNLVDGHGAGRIADTLCVRTICPFL